MQPLLSIVIANYNYGRFLEEALESVFTQDCPDFEVIIVDGGSKDNSVGIIKKHADKIAWWCSEPDKGQSNAFNKGFSHAKGRFLTWLNADDLMVPGTVSALKRAASEDPAADWFTGNSYRFLDADKKVIELNWGPRTYPGWLQGARAPIAVFGPTTFFSRKIFDAAGPFNETMRYMMDNDMWARFMAAGVKQHRLNHLCWAFRMHEASRTAEFEGHVLGEKDRAAFATERAAFEERTGYHMSQVLRIGLDLWRLFDGSYCYGRWLYWRLRK